MLVKEVFKSCFVVVVVAVTAAGLWFVYSSKLTITTGCYVCITRQKKSVYVNKLIEILLFSFYS